MKQTEKKNQIKLIKEALIYSLITNDLYSFKEQAVVLLDNAELLFMQGIRCVDKEHIFWDNDELKSYAKVGIIKFANVLYKELFKEPMYKIGEKIIFPINGVIDSITFNNVLEKFLNEEYYETDGSKKEI